MIIGILSLCGGVWITQDAIASILFYLKHNDERWHFNHAVRLFRGIWGLVFIGIGVWLIL